MQIGEEHWAVEAIEAQTAAYTRVRVVRIGRAEVSRAGYRGRS